MTRYILSICTLLILSFAIPSYADSDDSLINEIAKREKVSPDDVRKSIEEGCSSGNTALMNECAHYHEVGVDIELNLTYQSLMKKLGTKAARTKLVKAQRAWLAFRDATCEYENDGWAGGSGFSALYISCLQYEAKQRIKTLNEYLTCEDVCPGTGYE